MNTFSLWHWTIVVLIMLALGYPLSVLCKLAGYPAAVGWVGGTIGLVVGGPFWLVWWLALTSWKPAPSKV